MRRHPNSMTIWMPDEDAWVFKAVKEYQRQAEAAGIPMSQSQVIRAALIDSFSEMKARFDVEKIDR